MMKHTLKLIFCAALMLAAVQCVMAQSSYVTRTDLIIRNNGGAGDTLTFGVAWNATYCIDTAWGEYELPPKPPTDVFDIRFTTHRATETCLGEGVLTHLQGYVKTLDTFKVEVQAGGGGYPITFQWAAGLGTDMIWQDLRLKDAIIGILVDVDMLTNTSATVMNNAIDKFYVIGTAYIVGVKQESKLIPDKFALDQNYPNPFNPTTNIKFAIEKSSSTEVSVFDVLGRKVATLVNNEELTPGYYSVRWNGTDDRGASVGSGIY